MWNYDGNLNFHTQYFTLWKKKNVYLTYSRFVVTDLIYRSRGWKIEPWDRKTGSIGFVFESLPLNMNCVLSGHEMGSIDLIFRGLEMRGLKSQLTWIGYKR